MRKTIQKFSVVCVALLGVAALTQGGFAQEDAAEAAEEGETVFVMPNAGPFNPEQIKIPNAEAIAAWARSGHSDASSEAFSHWDEDGEIRGACSVCHSGAGFRAFYGFDGGPGGVPEHPMPIGGVVDCDTCHNPGMALITEVALPTGAMHPVAAGEASCLTCHQGRAAGSTVSAAVADKADDTPNSELSFINPHYKVAAATSLGGYGGAGFQYPDKTYSGRFFHARPVETCVSCHEPHSLEVAAEPCLTCHLNGEPAEIRISRVSYDGSGDLSKGIRADIDANAGLLQSMIEDYAAQVAGTPMIYDGQSYPYFFADANGDGAIDQAEGAAVAYNAWTPRLLKAAYNWKFVTADPGVHVHNPHYALELLYDSVEDLSGPVGVDFATLGIAR